MRYSLPILQLFRVSMRQTASYKNWYRLHERYNIGHALMITFTYLSPLRTS